MKKILLGSIALLGLANLASCSSEEDLKVPGGDGVTFTLRVPGTISTRGTFGDGTDAGDRATLDNLEWTVYEVAQDGTLTKVFSDKKPAGTAFTGSQTVENVTIGLAKGKTYQVAFYADNAANGFAKYNEGAVEVDYANAASNTAAEDAFIGKSEVFTVTGAYDETVTLTRPFAQLNWGTDDLGEKSIQKYLESQTVVVKVTNGLFKKMDVITGTVDEAVTDAVEFDAVKFTELPANKFPVDKEDADAVPYALIAMNYLLTGDGTIDCSLVFNNDFTPVDVNSAPVKVNYRTNIFGSLLTAPGHFNIKVDNNFVNNLNIVRNASQFAAAIVAGGDIEVPADAEINLDGLLGGPNDPTVKIINPTNLTVNGKLDCGTGGQLEVKAPLAIKGNGSINGGIRGFIYVTEGGTLEVEDITFNSPEAYRGGDVWNQGGGSMSFKNVKFNSNMASVYFEPASGTEAVLDMDGCVINNTSRNSIVNPETNKNAYSYAIRVHAGSVCNLRNMDVTGIQGGIMVGTGATMNVYSGTYRTHDSAPNKGDGWHALYIATRGTANVYGGGFSSPAARPCVYNSNEDIPDYDTGVANLFGGKYSNMPKVRIMTGMNEQTGKPIYVNEDIQPQSGFTYKTLTGEDPYTLEIEGN